MSICIINLLALLINRLEEAAPLFVVNLETRADDFVTLLVE